METEKAVQHLNEDKNGAATVNLTHDVVNDLINEAKEQAETYTNGTNNTTNKGESVEKESKKSNSKIDTAGDGKTSERVREGQRWNDRPRKFDNKNSRKPYKYEKSHDRVQYKKNIKSDLTSQQESSDPAAIRKQVQFPDRSRNYTNLMI
jgi:hypothetical protein